MMTGKDSKVRVNQRQQGIAIARNAGKLFGSVLLLSSFWTLLQGASGSFPLFRAGYSIVYGLLLCLPFAKFGKSLWKTSFAGLCVFSAGFVFVLIVAVMLAYMEMAERGERLGVPGLEGSLVFMALLQPPAVLFERYPDLFD